MSQLGTQLLAQEQRANFAYHEANFDDAFVQGTQIAGPIGSVPGLIVRRLSYEAEPAFRIETDAARKAGQSISAAQANVRIVLRLQEFWALSDQQMLSICGLPEEEDSTFAQSLAKYASLPDVRRRLQSLLSIRTRLSALLAGNREGERLWLATPWARIRDQAPIDLMASGDLDSLLVAESMLRDMVGG